MDNLGKHNLKLFLCLMLVLISAMGLVYAAVTVTLDSPAHETWDTDGDVTLNFTCTGNADQYLADLNETWTYSNGTYLANTTGIFVVNANTSNISSDNFGILKDGKHDWMITCYNNSLEKWVENETISIVGMNSVAHFANPTIDGENYTGVEVCNLTASVSIDPSYYRLTDEGIMLGNNSEWDGSSVNVTYWYNQSESTQSSARSIWVDATAPTVILNSPLNSTWGGTTYHPNRTFLINASCADQFPNHLYFDVYNATNGFIENGSKGEYENGTDMAWYWDAPGDGRYVINIRCDDDAGNMGSNETNVTVYVDNVDPSVTINTPGNSSWSTTGNITFNFTVVEDNIDTCELWGNFSLEGHAIDFSNSASVNATLTGVNNITTGATNNNLFNTSTEADAFTTAYNFNSSGILSTPLGYQYAVRCNDSAGNVETSANITFAIDVDDPPTVNLGLPYNLTTSSNYLPNISWDVIADLNFETYTIYISENSTFAHPTMYNITSNDTGSYVITTDLEADKEYYWKVNATALSGRGSASNESTGRYYKTDSTCHTLSGGYNYCGIVRDTIAVWDGSYINGINMSQIINETGASYAYFFNTTHDWITHQANTTTNAGYTLSTSDVVVLYMTEEHVWPLSGSEYAGRVWSSNISMVGPSWDINFTNVTDGYNLFSVRVQEGRTFHNITNSLTMQGWNATNTPNGNASILYMTYVNNSGINETCHGARDCGQFVPFRYNWTINNDTSIKYGESIWAYLNGSTRAYQSAYWNRSCDIAGIVNSSCFPPAGP